MRGCSGKLIQALEANLCKILQSVDVPAPWLSDLSFSLVSLTRYVPGRFDLVCEGRVGAKVLGGSTQPNV
jgi:hypothetical protein